MEEVDSIILHFLRQLNIHIDDEVKSICDLPVETIIQAASKCLIAINQSLKVPTSLPSGISHRIEVAAQIASFCKDLGFKNDVGYQTFLYYNEAELRQVFMFLIERLPTEGKQKASSITSEKPLFMQNISRKISEDLSSIWIPPCCNVSSRKTVGDFAHAEAFWTHSLSKSNLSEDMVVQRLSRLKDMKHQVEVNYLTTKEKAVEHIEKQNIPKEEVKCKINKSLKELKETAIVLRQKLDALESEHNAIEVTYAQMQKSCERANADLKNVNNILFNIGVTETDPENLKEDIFDKVQNNISMLHTKSEDLTSKNLFLKLEISKMKDALALTESERNKCKKILVNLKEQAKSMKEEYEKKEELKHQLQKKYDKIRGGNKRSIYTKRILEIISNVDKQNLEIQKILEDTRQLQKEINSLEGQLDRCFSVADETLFRDAKKDDQAKKAYKLLALLHSECNTIVSLVNDTGMLARDIVDIEDNIKTEKAKRTEDTLKKIQVDLVKMQEESKALNH